MASTMFPKLPVPHTKLAAYIADHPNEPVQELLAPFRNFEAQLRQTFAQDPQNPILQDPHVNVVPIYTDGVADIKIRSRDLDSETKEERSKYIMELPVDQRRLNGTPAVVSSLKDFQRNFNIFSESSLVDMEWSNVMAAGSSVVTPLLPVPRPYDASKRKLREFYHEKFCPASDVDLFLYGLTEEQAIEKIRDIEARVRDSILAPTTTVRTKHAITICSQYPTRHIQIVLRIYKSVSEILTGFDVDCSGAAYDGKQVYCTPRALQALITQTNTVDLSRRSPSYENRLSKYSHRGFEVHWSDLDRARIDPTIFERSFQRTLGLARLLVLERLPTVTARDAYRDKRRAERGRPPVNQIYGRRNFRSLRGNIKDGHEDEVAEWVDGEDVSNYNTFSIPYGPNFHAKRIEKLCYTRDLLLNAEWNQQDDRADIHLHRHPAFFGRFEDVVGDCCGYCPTPKTDEEKKLAEEEGKIFVSGKISFLTDDPGRQQIGSFNPLTDDDWTDMAYVGNTARLCQAIVDCDAEQVADWLAMDGADPNKRDYTGRSPLHLAVMCSSAEVVRLLVDAGARLIARIADGRTALHLAAERGDVEIVKILMDKSVANEAEHEENERRRKDAISINIENSDGDEDMESGEELSDEEMIDAEDSDDDGERSAMTGSYIKVKEARDAARKDGDIPEEGDEPDFYDVNVIAWDTPCSALHFAIVSGHEEVVKLLVQEYGADALLPVKFLNFNKKPTAALLTLVLALALPVEKAKTMATTLLSLGATCAQADMNGVTAFHRYVLANADALLDTLWEHDKTGFTTAINHMPFPEYGGNPHTPLQNAIKEGNLALALRLLDHGALPTIDFETWLKAAKKSVIQGRLRTFDENQRMFRTTVEQPLILALRSARPEMALKLLERGVDPNVLTCQSQGYLTMNMGYGGYQGGESALDIVNSQLKTLREYKGEQFPMEEPKDPNVDGYLETLEKGSYKRWVAARDIYTLQDRYQKEKKKYDEVQTALANAPGVKEKQATIEEAIATLEKVREGLLAKGAKTFLEMHPDRKQEVTNPASFPAQPFKFVSYGLSGDPPGTVRPNPYKFVFNFGNVTDVTGPRGLAYEQLFDAAWTGDLDTIKKLTLTSWDDAHEQPPLKMDVNDNFQNHPFTIAFSRGHYQVAKAILEIIKAQYSPREAKKVRYRMETGEEDSDDEGCGVSDDNDNEPRIMSEIVDDKFTIEDIGKVSMKVTSHTKPMDVLVRSSPEYCGPDNLPEAFIGLLGWVIKKNDMTGLKNLLNLAEHFSVQEREEEAESSQFWTFPDFEFQRAIELGRTEMLAEIIKRTGAGLPLEALVKDTGIEMQEKPTYYAGLTVYGKKRQDWAQAGRGAVYRPVSGLMTTPLLIAAQSGCIESVEWFLSDTPLRLYVEFATSSTARDDARLKHLKNSPGGFEGAISKWLNEQNDLILHTAIFAPPTTSANKLINYLITSRPETITTKSQNDSTPLLIAAWLGRLDAFRMLLAAGADPTAKTDSRQNILHLLLSKTPTVDKLRPFLSLLPKDLLDRMITERNSTAHGGGGDTPLHAWLDAISTLRPIHSVFTFNTYYTPPSASPSKKDSDDDKAARRAVLALLLDKSGTAPFSPAAVLRALETLDGPGDTPLHTLISRNDELDTSLVRDIIAFAPGLLLRENAVGRTPAEAARERFVGTKIVAPRGVDMMSKFYVGHGQTGTPTLAALPPSAFVGGAETGAMAAAESGYDKRERAVKETKEAVWEIVRASLEELNAESGDGERDTKRRRLVSLHEANDVARRLGEQQAESRFNDFKLAAIRAMKEGAGIGTGNGNGSDEDQDNTLATGTQRGTQRGFVRPGRIRKNRRPGKPDIVEDKWAGVHDAFKSVEEVAEEEAEPDMPWAAQVPYVPLRL